MNQYLLVVYDSRKHDYYNRIVSSTSKEMATVEFIHLKREEDVLINVIYYG